MTIRDAADAVPHLKHAVDLVLRECDDLAPGARFQRKGTRWVLLPQNFVTLSFHPRSRHIRVTLRGYLDEFNSASVAGVESDRPGYCATLLSDQADVGRVIGAIRLAAEHYRAGPSRRRGRWVVHDTPECQSSIIASLAVTSSSSAQ